MAPLPVFWILDGSHRPFSPAPFHTSPSYTNTPEGWCSPHLPAGFLLEDTCKRLEERRGMRLGSLFSLIWPHVTMEKPDTFLKGHSFCQAVFSAAAFRRLQELNHLFIPLGLRVVMVPRCCWPRDAADLGILEACQYLCKVSLLNFPQ